VRTKAARTLERLWQAITEAFAAITSQDAQGWCTHAGDRVQSNGKALSPTHLRQGLAYLDTAVGYWYAEVTGDLRKPRVCKDLREECVMSEPQEQAAVPLHWHIFRHDEHGGKQYMLPKPRQNILYTSAEINRLYPAPEYLYAVYTSSKSHNCSAGNSNRA
jgi:hypothetical protein